LNGGLDCQGVSIETPKCNEQACPVLLDIKTQAFGSGDTTLSCNPGYYLLSCGLANTQSKYETYIKRHTEFSNGDKVLRQLDYKPLISLFFSSVM
jgi:hypothetical protein